MMAEMQYCRRRRIRCAGKLAPMVLFSVLSIPSVPAQIVAQERTDAKVAGPEAFHISKRDDKSKQLLQEVIVNKGAENNPRADLAMEERLLRQRQTNKKKVTIENIMSNGQREQSGGSTEQRYSNGGGGKVHGGTRGNTRTGRANGGGGHGHRKKTGSNVRNGRTASGGAKKKARQRVSGTNNAINIKKRNRGGARKRRGNGGRINNDNGGKPVGGQSGQSYKPFIGYYPNFDDEICVYDAQYPNYMRPNPEFYFSNTINECCRLHYKGIVKVCIDMSVQYAKDTNPTFHWGHDGWHSPSWHSPSWHSPEDMGRWDRCRMPPRVSNPPEGPGVIVNPPDGHKDLHVGIGGWRFESNNNGGGHRRVQRRNNFNYCGTSWEDANSKCNNPCPNGVHSDCPNGELCFADADRCPATSGGNASSNVGGSNGGVTGGINGGSNPGAIINQPGDPYWGCDEWWHGDGGWVGSESGKAWGGDSWGWQGGKSGKAR